MREGNTKERRSRQEGQGVSLHLWDCRERTHGGREQAPRVRGPPPRSSGERGNKGGVTRESGVSTATSSLALESRKDGVEEEEEDRAENE